MTTNRPRTTHLRAGTIAIALALTVAVILALTGCSSDGSDDGSKKPGGATKSKDAPPGGDSDLAPAGDVLATVQGDEDMIARIMNVEREDGVLTVTAILENAGDEDFLTVGWKDEPGLRPYTLAGSNFFDKKNKTRHWPLYEADTKSCVCTEKLSDIEAGEKKEVTVSFPDVLSDARKVSLSLATFPPTDIPVPLRTGTDTVPPAAAEPPQNEPSWDRAPRTGFEPYDTVRRTLDIVAAARASLVPGPSAPRIRDLVFRIEYIEKKDTLSLSNRGMTYGLQSTLLFAKDSAQLAPGAGREVGELAKKIAATERLERVRITGYTDNLGSAAHGVKLSRDRADAIKNVMQKAAPGVTYQARGLGEKAPVARNSTEEGRQKNRRVEIAVEVARAPLPAPGKGTTQ